MRTTKPAGRASPYIGVDATDAFAATPRPMDACGLHIEGGQYVAGFWTWTFEDGGLENVAPLLSEIRAASGTVIDAPQALASPGQTMREAERALGAAGKTPSTIPNVGPPFAGFVRSGVLLFEALHQRDVPISAPDLARGVGEHYPGAVWSQLAGYRLPVKTREPGRASRRAILECLGVVFPQDVLVTHDHLDACLGAVIAAAADGKVPGVTIERVGLPLVVHDGRLREGPILVPSVDEHVQANIAARLTEMRLGEVANPVPRHDAVLGRGAAGDGSVLNVLLGVTSRMVSGGTDAIAVSGLAGLGATKQARQKIELLDYGGGHLWLGDHTMFWRAHQTGDPAAEALYESIRAGLTERPDEMEEVAAIVGPDAGP